LKIHFKIFFAFIFITSTFSAQKKVYWDTLKYQKFNTNLIVGYFQSYRTFRNEFKQFLTIDTAGTSINNWNAESRLISGIDLSYDKFSVSLGLRTKSRAGSEGKGNTNTFNLGLNFGGNKWFLENSYRYFKGFYDSNSHVYDTTLKKSGIYQLQPNFENRAFRSKFLYYTNFKKYSSRASTSCSYRQIKSAATFILSASMSYYDAKTDSSFFSPQTRNSYFEHASLNNINVIGVSLNAGVAGTLVLWKALFLNGQIIIGPEQQWRYYGYKNSSQNLSYVSWSGDGRVYLGLNFKRLYIVAGGMSEFAVYNSNAIGLTSSSISGYFSFGWRFKQRKPPEFYKKFQQTRFYMAL
jgi:hypothetical protein